MAEYYNVTTNLGDAEVANAIATNTKVDITHIAFGDGNGSVPTPSKSRTTLVREVHRQAVTKYERHPTNPNWIVIETIIPSDIGGFTIREMGIIGNGKLLSHGSHAPFEKVADPSGVSEYRLKFTQNITDGNVVSITLDDSLIFATQAWVEENFIKRSEIVDNLITADPNKPLSANAGKSLQDGKLGKNDNAVSATKLQTARTIGGVSFDGTANINLPGVNVAGNQSTSGNAATATKLATIRSLSFSGDASGTMSFDGSANVSTNLTLSNTGVVAGTYKSVTVDAKGRISAGNDVITGLVTATTATGTENQATSNTNTFLNITEKIGSATTTVGTSTQVTGAGTVSVTSDTIGKITITGAQSITGNAATATKLQTARTIAISGAVTGTATGFDGSANIAIATTAIDGSQISTGTIPAARIPTLNQSTTGNAATATKLATPRTIAISGAVTGTATSFDGSGNIEIATTAIDGSKISTGTIPAARIPTLNQSTTGNAATATELANARTINGVSFNGTSNINLPLLGYDQAWQNVKSSRNSGVVYTNTTGKPIQLFICANFDATGKIEIDGISLPIYDQEAYGFIFVVIPAGSTYKVTVVNTALLQTWAELR